jgi:hypothetical protein
MKIADLQFGFKRTPIAEAPAFWGARAIYSRGEVDLLWDRQDLVADDDAAKARLKKAVNAALKKFCKWAGGHQFAQDNSEVRELVTKGVHFWASTNASYGYLYVTAALEAHALPTQETKKSNETAAS